LHHQRAAFTITIQQSKYQARSTQAARETPFDVTIQPNHHAPLLRYGFQSEAG
jgi:hypothetical protein